MRVVVTGATGNVGTSVVEAFAASPEIESIVGLARRLPDHWSPPKTEWVQADVAWSDLEPIFRGADAVIHLAWAIQPSHDEEVTERINVEGSRRVLAAIAAAKVPRLVYASSIGAYSPGPKDRPVDESWPTGGIETSFYARHKAEVERELDVFELVSPEVKVVRLRPALIFKRQAASEIRRLFAGPLLPSFLLHPRLVPILPWIAELRFQAVHTDDVADAFLRATLGDLGGAFNIAAEPVIGPEEVAELFAAGTVSLPSRVVRSLVDATWRLHLQPSGRGWIDMARAVPVMSTRRARDELGWSERKSSLEAFSELLAGLREGAGMATPTLRPSSAKGRIAEIVRTGVGAKQPKEALNSRLVDYLTDAHSIEEQALTQMREAPALAGDPGLAAAFRAHQGETAEHERLHAHQAKPSHSKDAAGKAGGSAMLLFARSRPDTPGMLCAHAYSYEHMEAAAYELLGRIAAAEGDPETADAARAICAQERAMAERLAENFDAAVEASLRALPGDDLDRQLDSYIADAHALEQQALMLLRAAPALVTDEVLAETFRRHRAETEKHSQWLDRRRAARGSAGNGEQIAKDAALALGGINLGAFFGAQPDSTVKLAGFAYAFEHIEIGAYELLRRVAERAGDTETAATAVEILADERNTAEQIAASWDRVAAARVAH